MRCAYCSERRGDEETDGRAYPTDVVEGRERGIPTPPLSPPLLLKAPSTCTAVGEGGHSREKDEEEEEGKRNGGRSYSFCSVLSLSLSLSLLRYSSRIGGLVVVVL